MKRVFLVVFIILGSITINGKVQGSLSLNKSEGNSISSKAFFSKQVGDLFTMDIKDVALEEVLREISRKNGIVFSLPTSLAEEKVRVRFSNLKLDEGVAKILQRRYDSIFIYMEQTSPPSQSSATRLTKVKIYPRSNKNKQERHLTILPERSIRTVKIKDKVKKVDKTKRVERLEEKRKKLIEGLSLGLRDKNRGVRMEAIKLLSKIDDERVFGPLSFALKDKDPGVKREAEKVIKEKADSLKEWNEEMEEPESEDVTEEELPEGGDSPLTLTSSSGNGAGVELNNSVPVKGVQFTLEGAQPTEIRTTSRTKGFFAQFNKDNGTVILVSLSGNKIAPGTGPIAEIVCKNTGSASLSGVKIVE